MVEHPPARNLALSIFLALRPHHWAKNLLVFIPAAAAHRLAELPILSNALLAFTAFGLCASATYILNDLVDLEADRRHPRKRQRPFAAGQLAPAFGVALASAMLVATVLIALLLPAAFLLLLAGYFTLTLAYSLFLKRLVLVDTIVLAALYALRVISGAAAVAVAPSFWLSLFCIFLFLSLALLKRYAELADLQLRGELQVMGRGYRIADLPILHSLGCAAGYLCVLVLGLYMNAPAIESLYRHPQAIWLLCLILLYWISRVWLIAHRGEMHDDPLVFAFTDKTSLALGVLAAMAVWLAI